MNKEDITRMAREAWRQTGENWVVPHWFDERAASFEHFANLVAAQERERCYEFIGVLVEAEREECAKLCDHMASRCNDIRTAALEVAAENIRARGAGVNA